MSMHSARTRGCEDDSDLPELEPEVLSYTQFRNQMGLLEWKRRLAQHEQGKAPVPRVSWRMRALHAVNRL
jgi:hypothetical protein